MSEVPIVVRRWPVGARRARRRGGRVTAVLVVTVVVVAPVGAEAGTSWPDAGPGGRRSIVDGRQEHVTYVPPVSAPVVDPFRPPATPYGPGNRGIEYATSAGDEVRASAAGEVLFAGEVAGALHVTVGHADGVRTSYSLLLSVEVVRGQRVAQGARLGTAGGRLHVGARIGDVYVDPAALFAASGDVRVELLPLEAADDRPTAERRFLADIASTAGWHPPGPDGVGRWLRDDVCGGPAAREPGGLERAPAGRRSDCERSHAVIRALATGEAIGLVTDVLSVGSGSTVR